MAQSFNRVTLIGRLGQDPHSNQSTKNTEISSFSLATEKTWTQDGQKQKRTDWHRIIAWNKLASICNSYLRKGYLVHIEGELRTNYLTRQDGTDMRQTEVHVTQVTLLPNQERP